VTVGLARFALGRSILGPLVLLAVSADPTIAQVTSTTPGALRSAATVHSIGLEWDLIGDSDHDAVAIVQYRAQGVSTWKPALPLIRVDWDDPDDTGVLNLLAGSLFFLSPGTTYEIQIDLSDPDGGSATRNVTVTTRTEPVLPTSGRTLHVVPGSSGGDGSAGNPYRGLAVAWTSAQPGDVFLIHGGSYGTVTAQGKPSGASGSPIVFQAFGDGAAVLEWIDLRYTSRIWLEGLSFTNTGAPLPAGALDSDDNTAVFASVLNAGYDQGYQSMASDVNGIVIRRCTFVGYKHAVRAGPRTSGWFVTDNTITGDRTLGIDGTASFDGEGVELGGGNDHIVAYNRITRVADAISSPNRNCDIYGNDIYDVSDDGIEMDGGEPNTRAWMNRIHNPGHNCFSFQPQGGAPWYIVRNQCVVKSREAVFKFRGESDRYVALHNTFVKGLYWTMDSPYGEAVLPGTNKNNVWISLDDGIWADCDIPKDWRTDQDYEAFDWPSGATSVWEYNGSSYSTLSAFRTASGLQQHGLKIDRATCFESFDVPSPTDRTVTVPAQHMTLATGCAAIDGGVVLPNVNDGYAGAAPDIGAFERGQAVPAYGPRTAAPPTGPVPPTGFRVQ